MSSVFWAEKYDISGIQGLEKLKRPRGCGEKIMDLFLEKCCRKRPEENQRMQMRVHADKRAEMDGTR